MGRWQPDAHVRLEDAALELFAEHGFEAVSTAQIAQHAGLTKATFFRHFRDKPEVLFWGQELLAETFAGTIATGDEDAPPLALVRAAVLAVSPIFDADRHRHAATRQGLIASSTTLVERAALKRSERAQAMTEALRARGVRSGPAGLAGLVGEAAFDAAYARWASSATYRRFAPIARRELDRAVRAVFELAEQV